MGLSLELERSREFHSEGIPLLVSPQLLRTRDLGQLDLARLRKVKEEWRIEIAEVKSSQTGMVAILRGQRRRILSAANFLSGIFGYPAVFKVLTKEVIPEENF